MIDLARILDDRLAIVGTSGSGKTYAAKGMVEQLVTAGARVCVVDALGVWWGLRAGADGGAGGLPVLILGGAHADVPLREDDAAAVARAIAASAAQCVVDLSELGSGAARRRFMAAFLEELYEHNQDPLHLVLDEADLWAPQRPRPEGMTLLGRVDEIVRRGRIRGFIPWLITQRPAVLHKDVLSQADVLVAMKLTSSQDRAAIGAWIEGQADRAQAKALLAALPRLQRGEGWVWAPGASVLEQVSFPPIATFDSSRTPGRTERVAGPGALATVDAASFRALLGGGEEKPAKSEVNSERSEDNTRSGELRQAHSDGYVAGYRAGKADWSTGLAEALHAANATIAAALADAVERLSDFATTTALEPTGRAAVRFAADATLGQPYAKPEPDPPSVAPSGGLPRTTLRILAVLAQRHPAPQTEAQWAALAGMSRRGGAWNQHRRALEAAGLVAETGRRWSATQAGRAATGLDAAPPQSASETLAVWKRALGTGPSRLLEALLLHPEGLDRTQLGAVVRMAPGGGAFNAHLRDLVNNELVRPGSRNRYVADPTLRDGLAKERASP